jgi:hypothetical protein
MHLCAPCCVLYRALQELPADISRDLEQDWRHSAGNLMTIDGKPYTRVQVFTNLLNGEKLLLSETTADWWSRSFVYLRQIEQPTAKKNSERFYFCTILEPIMLETLRLLFHNQGIDPQADVALQWRTDAISDPTNGSKGGVGERIVTKLIQSMDGQYLGDCKILGPLLRDTDWKDWKVQANKVNDQQDAWRNVLGIDNKDIHQGDICVNLHKLFGPDVIFRLRRGDELRWCTIGAKTYNKRISPIVFGDNLASTDIRRSFLSRDDSKITSNKSRQDILEWKSKYENVPLLRIAFIPGGVTSGLNIPPGVFDIPVKDSPPSDTGIFLDLDRYVIFYSSRFDPPLNHFLSV